MMMLRWDVANSAGRILIYATACSYGFPMGFPMVFQWFLREGCDFPMGKGHFGGSRVTNIWTIPDEVPACCLSIYLSIYLYIYLFIHDN